ncbi:hypothetical protein FHR70_000743 [Microvirga lupini]|uniref:Uncharacterized protein n=1 Tax=Microvirga lupini TaxID=420324 RepID=A0A7W4VI79_9HYPH|nr:GIY-YIG nuclease family protein [Microvirga lupini]MBB3017703.1 hypothetical protein [Microvirga lupini]
MAAFIGRHFYLTMPKFTIDECFEEAKKYSARVDFFKGSPAAYAALQKRKLLSDACSHMTLSPRYSYTRWDVASAFAEAAKYKNRAEFKRKCPGAYEFALANEILDQACSTMRSGHRFWHLFELMAVALKYDDWGQFQRHERQAYTYATKYKLQALASSHMKKLRITWTKDLAMAEAAKHQSRGLFQAAASGAYKHADQYGYLDEACAHMPPPEYGFSKEKPSVLYHLRITTPSVVLYKIGITNRDPAARVKGMGVPAGTDVEVLDMIKFESGRDARIAEKRLHRRHAEHRYTGAPVLKNGNTELFTVNVLEI